MRFLESSLIDYPRPTLPNELWESDGCEPPRYFLKPSVRNALLSALFGVLDKNFKNRESWLVDVVTGGSASTQFFQNSSDIDVKAAIDSKAFLAANPGYEGKSGEDLNDAMFKTITDAHSGQFFIGEHPIEWYLFPASKLEDQKYISDHYDSLWSLFQNRWLVEPTLVDPAKWSRDKVVGPGARLASVWARKWDGSFGRIRRDVQELNLLTDYLAGMPPEVVAVHQGKQAKLLKSLAGEIRGLAADKAQVKSSRSGAYSGDRGPGGFVNSTADVVQLKMLAAWGYFSAIKKLNAILGDRDTVEPGDAAAIAAVLNVEAPTSDDGQPKQELAAARLHESFWISPDNKVFPVPGEHYDEIEKLAPDCITEFGSTSSSQDNAKHEGWVRVGYNKRNLFLDFDEEFGDGRVDEVLKVLPAEALLTRYLLVNNGQEIPVLKGEDAQQAWKRRNDPRHRIKADSRNAAGLWEGSPNKFWVNAKSGEIHQCHGENTHLMEWAEWHHLDFEKFEDSEKAYLIPRRKGWFRGTVIPGKELDLSVMDQSMVEGVLSKLPHEYLFVRLLVVDYRGVDLSGDVGDYADVTVKVNEGEDALKAWQHRGDPRHSMKAEATKEVLDAGGINQVGKFWISPEGVVNMLPDDSEHADHMDFPGMDGRGFKALVKAGWTRGGYSTTETLYLQTDKPVEWVLGLLPAEMLICHYLSVEANGYGTGVAVLEGEDAAEAWRHRGDPRHRVAGSKEPPTGGIPPGFISPDGKFYATGEGWHHCEWVFENADWLRSKGVDLPESPEELAEIKDRGLDTVWTDYMIPKGWIHAFDTSNYDLWKLDDDTWKRLCDYILLLPWAEWGVTDEDEKSLTISEVSRGDIRNFSLRDCKEDNKNGGVQAVLRAGESTIKAGSFSAGWVSPQGKIHPVGESKWEEHEDIVKALGLKNSGDAIENGWVRFRGMGEHFNLQAISEEVAGKALKSLEDYTFKMHFLSIMVDIYGQESLYIPVGEDETVFEAWDNPLNRSAARQNAGEESAEARKHFGSLSAAKRSPIVFSDQYWAAPDGKIFKATYNHGLWAADRVDTVLKGYADVVAAVKGMARFQEYIGNQMDEDTRYQFGSWVIDELIELGWVRLAYDAAQLIAEGIPTLKKAIEKMVLPENMDGLLILQIGFKDVETTPRKVLNGGFKSSLAVHAAYADQPNDWVHYTDVEKIGVNPKTIWMDPAGVFLFPAAHEPESSFWEEKPFVYHVKIKPGAKVFDISALTADQAVDFLTQAGMTDDESFAFRQGYSKQKDWKHYWWSALRDHFGLRQRQPGKFNAFFRDLGYDAIWDEDGAIHGNEPQQLVVLNPTVISVAGVEKGRLAGPKGAYEDIKKAMDDLESQLKGMGEVKRKEPTKGNDRDAVATGTLTVTNADRSVTLKVYVNPSYTNVVHVSLLYSTPSLKYGAGASYKRMREGLKLEDHIGLMRDLKKILTDKTFEGAMRLKAGEMERRLAEIPSRDELKKRIAGLQEDLDRADVGKQLFKGRWTKKDERSYQMNRNWYKMKLDGLASDLLYRDVAEEVQKSDTTSLRKELETLLPELDSHYGAGGTWETAKRETQGERDASRAWVRKLVRKEIIEEWLKDHPEAPDGPAGISGPTDLKGSISYQVGDWHSWNTLGEDHHEGVITEIDNLSIYVQCTDGVKRCTNGEQYLVGGMKAAAGDDRFTKLYKKANELASQEAKNSGAASGTPEQAEAFGIFQQKINDARTAEELQQAWEESGSLIGWEAVEQMASV